MQKRTSFVDTTVSQKDYTETNGSVSRRAYNLKAIKIEPAGGQLGISSSSSRPDTSSTISVSDLYALVKRYDKDFKPKAVNPALLNEDGAPKVWYHSTSAGFKAFKKASASPGTNASITSNA